MKIHLIKIEPIANKYDYYDGFVVVANTGKEVRDLATKADDAYAFNKINWYEEPVYVVGEYQGKETEPFILLSSYNAG